MRGGGIDDAGWYRPRPGSVCQLTCSKSGVRIGTEPARGTGTMFGWKQTRAALRDLRKDRSGVAAIEFAFIAGFLSLAVLNVSDTGIYLYKRMEVENAALVGTMSALKACDPVHLPATVNCPGLNAAVTAAIQSTSLGNAVT